ncbi:mediator of RNA polymerase II transcription subunit 11 [Ischnura elegans]|uniref:mediator of RNA polymerase II transcription subunit 11 n=1 Tax=Ischnura elegans TaxID=197161 RepID=UPI001ED870A7|nr:mediator of RNA polymerase II transcription subunit 11 [Ischnura elegans]
MTAPMERIQTLDLIEKDIINCLMSAGQALMELSKEKSSQKHAEGQTDTFLKTLAHVESKLTEQINYLTQVSTGQPHEGSGYASQKVLQMAWHRLEHARSRVNELERIKNKHLQGRTYVLRQQQAALTGGGACPQTQSANTNMQSQVGQPQGMSGTTG